MLLIKGSATFKREGVGKILRHMYELITYAHEGKKVPEK